MVNTSLIVKKHYLKSLNTNLSLLDNVITTTMDFIIKCMSLGLRMESFISI